MTAKKNKRTSAVVVAFGRFNPPSGGHQLLIETVQNLASKLGADHAMFSSRSHDSEKNPLSPSKKFKWLKKLFPKANFTNESSILTPIDMLMYLARIGYTDVVLVGGEDRAVMYKSFERLLKKTKERKSIPLKSISFKQAGERRDSNAKGVAGLSGSKLRQAVKDNNFKLFSSGLPSTISKLDAKGLFDDVKSGMKLKESTDYTSIFQSTAMRIIESKDDKLGNTTKNWLLNNWN